MTNDDEKGVGILFLTLLNSEATINNCIKKSGLTADKISTIISTPKFNRYFEKKTDEELYISSKVDWISDEIGHRIKINDSEAEILKESVQKKFINHVNKFWKEKGVVKRDFEIKNLPEWIISEYVFLSGFTMWFREKEKDDETDLSSLLSTQQEIILSFSKY